MSIYFFIYTGKPISDDEQLFANVARNISVTGGVSAASLSGNLRLKGDYHGIEPAHPALASLWFRLFQGSNFGTLQILYLLPIIYSITSCVLLAALAEKLGYPMEAGIMLVMLYGLGSMSFPYVKTFFREPLGGMVMLAMWLFYLNIGDSIAWKRNWNIAFFVSCGIFLLFLKVIYVSAVIPFLLLWIIERRGRFTRRSGAWLLGGLLLVLWWMHYSNQFTDNHVFYRISGGFVRDAMWRLIYMPHVHFIETMISALFSPLKGIFFYTPALFLSIFSMLRYGKRNMHLFASPLIISAFLLIFQALAYDNQQWWTPTWGARFLLPAVPLLLITALPLIHDLVNIRHGRYVLIFFFVIGFAFQLPAVLFNSSLFFAQAYNYSALPFWNISKSPLFLQWGILGNNPEFDLLIWRVFPYRPDLAILILVLVLILLLTSLWGLHTLLSNKELQKNSFLMGKVIISLAALSLAFSVLKAGQYDPFYRAAEFDPLCHLLRTQTRAGDIVIVYSYPGDLWDYFSNSECGQTVWYSLPYRYYQDASDAKYEIGVDVFSEVKNKDFLRLWFITQYDEKPLSNFEQEEFNCAPYKILQSGYVNDPVPVFYALYSLR